MAHRAESWAQLSMPLPASVLSWAHRFARLRITLAHSRRSYSARTKPGRTDPPTALRPQPLSPRLPRSAEVMNLRSLESGRQSRKLHLRTRASTAPIPQWTRWLAKRRLRAQRLQLALRQISKLSTSTPTNRAAAQPTFRRHGAAPVGAHLLQQVPMRRLLAATKAACSLSLTKAEVTFPLSGVHKHRGPRASLLSSCARFTSQTHLQVSGSVTLVELEVAR